MVKIILLAGTTLVGAAFMVVLIGFLLPKQHVASRAIALRRKPADVFQLISDFQAAPSWRSDVKQIELLPPSEGHIRYREKGADGTITMEIVESNPPARMITRIADKGLPFGGIWIFDISPTVAGCRLNITERGEIYNPVFRFVSRFLMGYHRTLDAYLQNVSRKFEEGSLPQDGTAATL
jgi:Polyketide cyclase / dehydrase and lipid transport